MADTESSNDDVGSETTEVKMSRAVADLDHKNPYRKLCLKLVRKPAFDLFIQGCILFNTLLMCLKWAPGPSNVRAASIGGDPTWDYLATWHGLTLMVLNIVLTAIFAFESIVKVRERSRQAPLGHACRDGPRVVTIASGATWPCLP